jgi:ATP-dependent RNA helicase SUPV3L1/SUV3
MIERLIKQAHEARKAGDIFEIDPALATSLGLSTAVHEALLKIAGFVKTDKAPDNISVDKVPDGEAEKEEKTASAADKPEQAAELSGIPEPSDEKPEIAQIYWRWKGMGKAQGNNSGKNHQGRKGKNASKQNYKPDAKARKPEPVLASAGGAFDALAALKESMKK